MQMQRISLFFLLSLTTLLFLWFAYPGDIYIMFFKEFIVSQIDLFEYFFELIGEEGRNILDGCHHVYLDMGSNTGVQIRWKLKKSLVFAQWGFLLRWWKLKTISLHTLAISAYCIKEQIKILYSGNFTSLTTFLILLFSKLLTNTLETKDRGENWLLKTISYEMFQVLGQNLYCWVWAKYDASVKTRRFTEKLQKLWLECK